ncbi:MAG: hypothetical protein JWL83_1910 [Actinomycetia bacterium]|nr:hypothetical protein [Actinomycetes bacterium]
MSNLIVVEDMAAPSVVRRGGQALMVLQHLQGLARLGHRVLFVEFLDAEPDPSAVGWFEDVMRDWWSIDQSALLVAPSYESRAGVSASDVAAAASDADAVITISAHYRREPWPFIDQVRPRILIDEDPAYTHLWAEGSDPVDIFGEHDVYFTVGGNVGSSRSRLPLLGIDWHTTWNPVVLDLWPTTIAMRNARFGTVAGLRDYGWLDFEDACFGPKVEELRKFASLPKLTGESFEILADLEPDDPDRQEFEAAGWIFGSPERVAQPSMYQDYVRGGAGEFSVAKGGYVGTHSGWFSDRSAAYLASGRPVVVQATGFEDLLPVGEGLFAVDDVDAAAAAIVAVRRDPGRHAAAARRIAEQHFDSNRILTTILATAGVD